MYYTETRKRGVAPEYDRMLVWATVLLLALGMVMVYSASIAIAEGGRSTAFQPTYYLIRHASFVAAALILAVVSFQIPMRLWQKASPYFFIAGLVLLVLVLIPGFGREVNG